jgi:hypothetical protein
MTVNRIRWKQRRLDVGDRSVVVVLTSDLAGWVPAIQAWQHEGLEWCICSEPWDISAGMATAAMAAHDNGDLLAVFLDRSGTEAVVDAAIQRAVLPVCPVGIVEPGVIIHGVDRYVELHGQLRDLGWDTNITYHWDPDPRGLISWALGWWDGRSAA